MTVPTMARDCGMIAWRNLVVLRRNPDQMLGAVLSPLVFVLVFAYVFAGSLGGPGYRHFLIAGLFVQTVTFNSMFTTVGVANDLTKGVIDRFRALPMSRLAVVFGRTASDLGVTAVTLAVMSVAGLVVGWRVESSPARGALGYLLLLAFAFAMSWVGAWIGLVCRTVEAAQSAGLLWLFPVTFVADVFVPAGTLPGPLRAFAEWNPVSAMARTARTLFGNPAQPPGAPLDTGWPAQHAGPYAVAVALGLVAVFLPLTLERYRRIASR